MRSPPRNRGLEDREPAPYPTEGAGEPFRPLLPEEIPDEERTAHEAFTLPGQIPE